MSEPLAKSAADAEGSAVSVAEPELRVSVDRLVPEAIVAGGGSVVFCAGSCVHPREALRELSIVGEALRAPVRAWAVPRRDLASAGGRGCAHCRSGFWTTIPIAARRAAGTLDFELEAVLGSGRRVRAPLARIRVSPPLPAPAVGEPEPRDLLAVCMATFEPDRELFHAQIESLRRQTDTRWLCVISDDCSTPERFAEIRDVVGSDGRFVVSRSDERRGFYRNFERALSLAPADAALIALCDQDDRWHPDKLTALRDALGDAQLAYSDLRLTTPDGRVLRDTLWRGRHNNHTDLISQLVANTITGAAILMRRELAELALPFPEGPGIMFHDHWIGALALACGPVAYVDRPLYDYVQHSGAVFGEVSSGGTLSLRARARSLGPRRDWFVGWRAAYFYGFVPRELMAQTLLLRCETRIGPARRRALERFINADRSLAAAAWLAARALRPLLGHSETLGSESDLVRGLVWRRLVGALSRADLPGWARFDSSLPALGAFEQRRLRRWRARV